MYELTVTSLFNVGILKCDIFFFFFFNIKCQECNKNRQNVFSTTNYFAMVQRINQCDFLFFTNGYLSLKFENFAVLKGYYCLSQSYPKLLSFSVLTFIKWRLTPSYAAKDTIFWQKRPKPIVIGIIVQDNKNSNLFIWPSMWTRLEHAHCLETINNMWFLGKRESVNTWQKADFDGFREKD